MAGSWKHILLIAISVGACAVVLLLPPITQDPTYHRFADQRSMFGIARFLDIATNLPFLIIGVAGLHLCRSGRIACSRRAWTAFFAAVALVGIGSAYYHADPNDRTLVWDRLPMTIGFMGILVAVLNERISERIESDNLESAIFAGIMSVLWWAVLGDLRPYVVVQLMPLLVIPTVLVLYPGQRNDDQLIMLSLMLYFLAKVFEHFDHGIYMATGQIISGHSLKHLLAAAGCAVLYFRTQMRCPAYPSFNAAVRDCAASGLKDHQEPAVRMVRIAEREATMPTDRDRYRMNEKGEEP